MSDLDELLADLEDDEDNNTNEDHASVKEEDQGEKEDTVATSDITTIAPLLHSAEMQDVLAQIESYSCQQARRIMGLVEADPEYKLIIRANTLSLDLDSELRVVVEFIKAHYAPRFPELEKLVLNPLDYARCVKVIGNEEDLIKLDLKSIVPTSTAMSIAVTATTTDGVLLSPDELTVVFQACDMVLALDDAKRKIVGYIQSRIEVIAPNVTRLVGALCAAKIVGQAGGLNALAKLPACNVPSIGKSQGIANGFSKLGSTAHGYLYDCELVQSCPEDVRKQALRQVSGKLILAARIDAVHEASNGEKGIWFKEELVRRLEKLSEPPELKDAKALAAPDDPVKKRRGGKKVRKAKEKYATTEMQKLRNRMAFGKEEMEVGYGDETEGLGMLGHASTIRAPVIDKRTRAKLSKPKTKGGHLLDPLNRAEHAHAPINGTASSLVLSSVQGIELPSLPSLKKPVEDRWFSSGTFTQLKKS